MAKALWEQPITKEVDWAGDDEHTNGAAVSGKYVQMFIKDTLNKKFGYLYYENNEGKGKYLIFADKDDFNAWQSNKLLNGDLVLATFDAPAPASIHAKQISSLSVVKRFGEQLDPIIFNYVIRDSSNNIIPEDVIMRITATSTTTGAVTTDVVTLRTSVETFNATAQYYKEKVDDNNNQLYPEYSEYDDNEILGSRCEYDKLSKLLTSADKYNIIITLMTASTQVSTTLAFMYQLIDINISSNFNYLNTVDSSLKYFTQNITVTGATDINKYISIYIDGKPLTQDFNELGVSKDRVYSNGDFIGTRSKIDLSLEIYMRNAGNSLVKWADTNEEIFSPGKHSMQIYSYVSIDQQIPSQILYYEFVIASNEAQTYLVYSSELTNMLQPNQPISLSGKQYTQIKFNVAAIDTRGRAVPVDYKYDLISEESSESFTNIDLISRTLASGVEDNVQYTLRQSGNIRLTITNGFSDSTLVINITSDPAKTQINEIATDNIFKFSAENHNNNDAHPDVWKNTSKNYANEYTQFGQLSNRVNFASDTEGWGNGNNVLTLKNNATVQFDGINLFNMNLTSGKHVIENSGWTFEIDFETFDVQNDDAPILRYENENSKSSLIINATSASITTNNGTTVKTNFKESERIKLAFIVNPIKPVNQSTFAYESDDLNDNPNTIFIMVNGVLDRVAKWGTGIAASDSFKWSNQSEDVANSFTIGNDNGEANVKIYSIRIYNRALTMDEEFMNYLNDQPGENIIDLFDKNDVFDDNDNVSFDKVKEMIPTMLLEMDYESYGSFDATKKKANTFAEVQYFDPTDQNLNFYARQCWVSPQGTSSMGYPVKNLRLYFGKSKNNQTFQNIRSFYPINSDTPVDAINYINVWPEYETEFWPISEYGIANDDPVTIRDWADKHLPYATNKKVDTTDGSEIRANGITNTAVHYGYHKIGANRTIEGKLSIIKNYLNLSDTDKEYDYKAIYDAQDKGEEITNLENYRKNVSLYIVNPPQNKTFGGKNFHKDFDESIEFAEKANNGLPIYVKDAFGDNDMIVYSTAGMDGYVRLDDGSYSNYRTEIEEGNKKINTEIVYDSFIELDNNELTDTVLRELLNYTDVYISAYRPLIRKGESLGSSSYKKYIDELRYSGVALYYWTGKKFKKDKGAINYNRLYYTIGANWRQYDELNHVSGWTDRWTLKADYAESSMTHNAGIGRLWGRAMKNVIVNGSNVCQTKAQEFANDNSSHGIDIRTSCDGKPIALFYKQIKYFDEQNGGRPEYDVNIKFAGLYNIMTDKSSTKLFGFEDITKPDGTKWSKSGDSQYKPEFTECWECLNNGSDLIKGLSVKYDSKNANGDIVGYTGVSKGNLGKNRQLWKTYEARWPDTGQERHPYNPGDTINGGYLGNNWPDDTYGVDSKNLESFLRWVNFCKEAVDYKIGDSGNQIDGYTQNLYTPVSSYADAKEKYRNYLRYLAEYNNATTDEERKQIQSNINDNVLYMKWDKSGNDMYSTFGQTYEFENSRQVEVQQQKVDENDQPMFDEQGQAIMETVVVTETYIDTAVVEQPNTVEELANIEWYILNWRVNMEIVTKTINNETIGSRLRKNGLKPNVWLVDIPSFDAMCRCDDEEGNQVADESLKYYVKTYVFGNQDNSYTYVDNFGETKVVSVNAIELDPENEHKVSVNITSAPVSCSGLTYMQYFSATKRDHLDLYKVAAYYIYLIRFAAVDQVIKNSMMTTEDGQHWYFINYDNDTTLGVRNDGQLVYNWDVDRNTFDKSINDYAFAGSQSVLWNCLEADEEFMNIVKLVDNAMSSQGLLSAEAVLDYLNEKQEGVWCQRLYNEQERIKYLSTVRNDFTNNRYLGFMHGTRHSHRNWWITHRWNLYDAKWTSGTYSYKEMKFKFTLPNASEQTPADMIIFTAASKYYFSLMRNTAEPEFDWMRELYANKSAVFTARVSNALGDPVIMKGPQKLKILNLRPNASSISEIVLAENYDITMSDSTVVTTNWPAEDGAFMTKLLIGNDNESASSTASDISGLQRIYSLEEIDIRGMKNLNGGVPNISSLNNLHRWRAYNSNATTFIPALGAQLYEVSLSNLTNTIELKNVVFTEDSQEYVPLQTKVLSGNSNYNDNNDVADGENDTKFGRAYGDILPVYDSLSAYKYCKSYVVDENGIPSLVPNFEQLTDGNNNLLDKWTGNYVFDYVPNEKLNKVIFNNVKGIDTYQFLIDWENSITESHNSSKNYSVNLTGIEWVLEDDDQETAVDKLIHIHDVFNYNNENGEEIFRGTVFIKRNTELTEDEQQRLKACFGEDVFKLDAPLSVNCSTGMTINISGGTEKPNNDNVIPTTTYYEVVKGTDFKISASIFPMSKDTNYVYVLSTIGFASTYSPKQTNTEVGSEEYTISTVNYNYAILRNTDGDGILWTDGTNVNWGISENQYLQISVCKYDATGQINMWQPLHRVYLKLVNRVMPNLNEIVVKDITNNDAIVYGSQQAVNYEILDNNVHEYAIEIPATTNVKVSDMFVAFNNELSNPQYSMVRYDASLGEDVILATFVKYEDGKYVHINNDSVDNNPKRLTFKIKHTVAEFANNSDVHIYFKLMFENGIDYDMIHASYIVSCTFIQNDDSIRIYKIDDFNENSDYSDYQESLEETPLSEIVINAIGTTAYKIYSGDHNIKYELHCYTSNMPTDYITLRDDDVIVARVYPEITTIVEHTDMYNPQIKIVFVPEVTNDNIQQIEKDIPVEINISYPDSLDMTCDGKVVSSNLKLINSPFRINVLNGIGTSHELEFETNTNMPYSIEVSSIELGEHTFTPDANNMSTTLKDASNANVNISLTHDATNNDSISKINVSVEAATGTSSISYLIIKCKLKFDNDTTDEIAPKYCRFNNISSNDKETVIFTVEIEHTVAAAMDWQSLNAVDDSDNEYNLYLVDKQNRFFKVGVNKATFELNDGDVTNIVQQAGVDPNDWRGIGFKNAVLNQDQSSVEYHPVFVALKQFVGFGWLAQNDELPLRQDTNGSYFYPYNYNGYNNTETMTQWCGGDGAIKRIFNTYDDLKLYIPSWAELYQIMTTTETANDGSSGDAARNGNYAHAINVVADTFAKTPLGPNSTRTVLNITKEKYNWTNNGVSIYDSDYSNNTKLKSFDELPCDYVDSVYLFGTAFPSSVNIEYGTSTIAANVPSENSTTMFAFLVSYGAESLQYSVLPGATINARHNVSISPYIVFVPFVNVQ